MSVTNPFAAQFGWRVDPDHRQDRGCGPVTTYKLIPEEIEARYGNVKGSGKKIFKLDTPKIRKGERVGVKNKTKVNKERILEYCREHGAGRTAFEVLAEEFGCSVSTVVNAYYRYNIKQILADEGRKMVKQAVQEERAAAVSMDKSVKYYISTGYDNKEKAAKLATVIEAAGGEITCKWWEAEYTEDIAELAHRGEAELQGVRNADMVIVMMPGREGTHTELGAALALGKRILLYGTGGFGAVPFYHVSGIKQVVGGELDLVAEILNAKE